MKPYVYVVESPGAADLFDGVTEGRALCEALHAFGYGYSYTLATNFEQFLRAFESGPESRLATEIEKNGRVAPIVHLSMHGNDDGIGLHDGTLVKWSDLRELLRPLNDALPNGVAICLSTCGGGSGIRMAMTENKDEKPLYALVGTHQSIPWRDALTGFTTFYHWWAKGASIQEAVERMKVASGHDAFTVYSGAEEKQRYVEFVQRQRIVAALTQPPTNRLAATGGLFGFLDPSVPAAPQPPVAG
jgi:hypothetical protein